MKRINKFISQTADQLVYWQQGLLAMFAGSLPRSGNKTGGHTRPLSPGEHRVHL
jgi:hypothetical protein